MKTHYLILFRGVNVMLCDLVERFRNGLDCKYSNIG